MIPKLSGECYAIRSTVHVNNTNTFTSIYDAYFHCIIKYRIIFWVNFSDSGNIFTIHKRIIRIMAGA